MITLIVVEVPINKNTKAWNLEANPEKIQSHAKVYNEADRVHPQAEEFTDMTEDNQAAYIEILAIIKAAYPGVTVYAMGSRFNGIFYEDSDFDIVVRVENDGQVAGIQALDFSSLELPGAVDIKISHVDAPETVQVHTRIEIPDAPPEDP